jgi:hypothetical protein
VVLSGLAETKAGDSDEKEVTAVLAAIGIEATTVKKVRRVGRVPATTETNRPRAVVVQFHDCGNVGKAITNRIKLKETVKCSKVYINNDVTDNERFFEFELRKRRNSMNAALQETDKDGRRHSTDTSGKNWYWGVRWGELRHIDKATDRAFKLAV